MKSGKTRKRFSSKKKKNIRRRCESSYAELRISPTWLLPAGREIEAKRNICINGWRIRNPEWNARFRVWVNGKGENLAADGSFRT